MEECNVCVVVLVGIPASGKTTFCKQACDYFNNRELCIKTIHYDELCSDFSSSSRHAVFISVEGLVMDYKQLEGKYVLLIDDNMYYKSMRSQYVSLAKKYQISFFQIFFKIDLEMALQRNGNRISHKIPEHVIRKMFVDLELPNKDVLTIDSTHPYDCNVFKEFEAYVFKYLNSPIKFNRECQSKPTPLSKLQFVDLLLRKCVNEKVSMNTQSARKYNAIRHVVLKNIKNGNIEIDHLEEVQLKCTLCSFFEV